jgi:hypothetical protein
MHRARLKKHKQEVTSSRSRTRMGGMSTVIGGLARISDEAPELLDVVPLKEGVLEGACPVALANRQVNAGDSQ